MARWPTKKPTNPKIGNNLAMGLTPMRFEPIFQYRLWGGRKLETVLDMSLSSEGPIGEAWILSDRDDFPSVVSEGPFAGQTVSDLIAADPIGMFGSRAGSLARYPLLLKFLDAKEMLSVQVHPTDEQKELLPPGERGKTEAWLVLESEPNSRIYAGLKPGTRAEDLRQLTGANSDNYLASFAPKVGETVFLPAGVVHALGGGVLVFEVQQNSDVTFRLFDWDRVDAQTGKPRDLHIEKAIQCTDFNQGAIEPLVPLTESLEPRRERLVACQHFILERVSADQAFEVGANDEIRAVICTEGQAEIEFAGQSYAIAKGQVYVLPAAVGKCRTVPQGWTVLLEVSLPREIESVPNLAVN